MVGVEGLARPDTGVFASRRPSWAFREVEREPSRKKG
jgi:hypothetical protein